jgi:hypothetical protein
MTRTRTGAMRSVALLLGLFSASANAADQILTPNGLGPVRIGMTVGQAEKALGAKLNPLEKMSANTQSCWYTQRADHIDPLVSYMIWFEKIVRIDIDNSELGKPETSVPPVTSEKGIHIGASEEQIKAAYGSAIKISSHAYGDEANNDHYWTALAKGGRNGLRFETMGGKVQSFHAGLTKAIQLVEGCS